MSQYLLDTHTLLWWDSQSEKVGERALGLLRGQGHTFLVSQASIWEIAIKSRLGKLTLPAELGQWIQESVIEGGFRLAPIELSAILETSKLPLHHQDPFDRLLIAQARVNQWVVLGADLQWDAYEIERVWS